MIRKNYFLCSVTASPLSPPYSVECHYILVVVVVRIFTWNEVI